MEYTFFMKESNSPCLVIADSENGRYAIRQADTSGKVFSTIQDLSVWINDHWTVDMFETSSDFDHLTRSIQAEITSF